MPLAICSSVLLPLPFGPMTAQDFAAIDVQAEVAQGPELLDPGTRADRQSLA